MSYNKACPFNKENNYAMSFTLLEVVINEGSNFPSHCIICTEGN